MTTLANPHVETAHELLAKAHAHLSEGNLAQASGKGWNATERMVKAVAETRDWEHSTHADLYRVVGRVAKETGDTEIRLLFRSAVALHQNSDEDCMPEGTVADALKYVEEITALLAAAID